MTGSSSVHGILQARILEWVAMPSSRGIFPTQGSNTSLPHYRWILYHLNYQGNPRIQVGSLTFLQWIFPTQESNQGLLHCRWILYQLRHQEGPAARAPSLIVERGGYSWQYLGFSLRWWCLLLSTGSRVFTSCHLWPLEHWLCSCGA